MSEGRDYGFCVYCGGTKCTKDKCVAVTEETLVCDNCGESGTCAEWCGDSSEGDYPKKKITFTTKNKEQHSTVDQITNNIDKEKRQEEQHQSRKDEEEKLRQEEEENNIPFKRIIGDGTSLLSGEKKLEDVTEELIRESKHAINKGGSILDKMNSFFGGGMLKQFGFDELIKKAELQAAIAKYFRDIIGQDRIAECFKQTAEHFNLDPGYKIEVTLSCTVPGEDNNNNKQDE